MLLLFIPFGNRNTASTRVRCYYFAQAISQTAEVESEILPDWRNDLRDVLQKIKASETVWFQKTFELKAIMLFIYAKSLAKKKVVVDIDDPLFMTHSDWKKYSGLSGFLKYAYEEVNRVWRATIIRYMVNRADAVTTDTQPLTAYFKRFNQRTFFVRDTLPLLNVTPSKGNSDGITIGWVGHGPSYEDDLVILREPMLRLGGEMRVRLVIVGIHGSKKIREDFKELGPVEVLLVEDIAWADESAVSNVVSQFDIGVIPLRDIPYNQLKGSLKAYEYMSYGLPFVASPVGLIPTIVVDGFNGFLARTPEEWHTKLKLLSKDRKLRKEVSRKSLEEFTEKYSFQSSGRTLVTVLTSLGAPLPDAPG